MTRCWVLEKGGDRCVLTTDHPGPHMGGYHTFTSIPDTEEMARLIGSHCDQLEHALRDKIAETVAKCGRLRAERDGLLEAAEAYLRLSTMADYFERADRRDALCAAVAACAPEVKP